MIWRHLMLAVPDVDFVPEHALDRVGRIARGLGAQIELFNSVYEPEIARTPATREQLEGHISERVGERHRRLERHGDTLRDQGLKVRASVRWDYPFDEAVVRQVLRHRPDLLILPASHAGAATPRVPVYREARLIETCPCPLLLLRTANVYSTGSVVAAVDPLHAFEIPAELDEAIIGAAKTVAYALGDADVRVFHAVSALPAAAGAARAGRPPVSAQQEARLAVAEARVREIAFRHSTAGDDVRVELGAVETLLPSFAREVRAQIVVMGAVSRSYPERAYFGHTAEKVLGALACDVLVIRPRGFRSPVSAEPAPAVASEISEHVSGET
jgi:universal stress protein E